MWLLIKFLFTDNVIIIIWQCTSQAASVWMSQYLFLKTICWDNSLYFQLSWPLFLLHWYNDYHSMMLCHCLLFLPKQFYLQNFTSLLLDGHHHLLLKIMSLNKRSANGDSMLPFVLCLYHGNHRKQSPCRLFNLPVAMHMLFFKKLCQV